MNRLANTQDTLSDAADAMSDVVAAIPFEHAGDLLSDTADGLADIADAAVDTVAATGRLGTKMIKRTVRAIARHPKEVLVAVVLIAAIMGVLGYLKSNSADAA